TLECLAGLSAGSHCNAARRHSGHGCTGHPSSEERHFTEPLTGANIRHVWSPSLVHDCHAGYTRHKPQQTRWYLSLRHDNFARLVFSNRSEEILAAIGGTLDVDGHLLTHPLAPFYRNRVCGGKQTPCGARFSEQLSSSLVVEAQWHFLPARVSSFLL